MKLAIISDIHGNLTSFEAVLADLERHAIDQVVCLGDVAAFGPQPRECLDRLKLLKCPVVMGNTDEFLLNPVLMPKDDPEGFVEKVELWGAEQLNAVDRECLASFQPTVTLDLENGVTLLAFHGSPRSNQEIIQASTPEDELDVVFEGTDAQILAGGHTHTVLLRRYRDSYLMNPGSVGLPHESARHSDYVRNPPWAEYAVISVDAGLPHIDFRRVPVDAQAIVGAIRDSGMPFADKLTADWG
jgi:putative phosphoesterase